MWVIVKHVTVWVKHQPTNEMAIVIEHGCHRSIEAAVTLCDDLNEREDTDVYDSVFVRNHS